MEIANITGFTNKAGILYRFPSRHSVINKIDPVTIALIQ